MRINVNNIIVSLERNQDKEIIKEIRKETKFIIVDFHAEATSEKLAMAYSLTQSFSRIRSAHTRSNSR